MIRTILKSDKNRLTLELPDDLVGRTLEIIAFPIDEVTISTAAKTSKDTDITILKNKLKKFSFNSGGYKFDRDEANDYLRYNL